MSLLVCAPEWLSWGGGRGAGAGVRAGLRVRRQRSRAVLGTLWYQLFIVVLNMGDEPQWYVPLLEEKKES